ncbi:hypothetical protein JHW43_009138 [Diplocarpon mali]|nr:hypothetical protein JHW43_009138 [Diplocarpon mali]
MQQQHHPHHAQQGPAPPHHLQQPRPSSIVHQHHQQQQQGPPQSQHSNPYPSSHVLPQYTQSAPGAGSQHPQELPYYTQQSHPSPYSTPSANGTYSSAAPDTPDIMAAAQMSRPYPPISYHTPQSNSPASVASSSGHDQHRMYGAPASQLQPNPQMYYAGPQQHPRTKMEPLVPQIPRPAAPLGPPQPQQSQPPQHPANGPPMSQNNVPGAGGGGVNPNAAPGPIPATTPLVVRQDNNGVQWIAFEYSRDRVKMEYTIRCDVESVNVDTLGPEFKTENCVYPRACCSKDQYRGNRLVYENECNTVGWALAELNPCLRGKRGLIQRAVDSWRNSNQDPRLRSRRVRRMAKINTRKSVQPSATHPPHMPGPSGPTGMPPSANMGPSAGSMGKPSLGGMGSGQLHHHHNHPDGSSGGGDDVDHDEYMDDEQHHHHHQAPPGAPNAAGPPPDDVRDSHAFPAFAGSSFPPHPSPSGVAVAPSLHAAHGGAPHSSLPLSGRAHSRARARGPEEMAEDERIHLFGDIPEAKKRKFILVDDPGKGGRVRVRVTLDTVVTDEIPDSFRKSNSVYPRSWFPTQMQSPPPSAHGSRFFEEGDEDDTVESEGRAAGRGRAARGGKQMVTIQLADGAEAEIGIPRMRKSWRLKEVRLNDLGYRMTWHQSRVFADKTVFLQKALDSYRNKVRGTMDQTGKDVATVAPHFETRVGKRRWNDRSKREPRADEP